jgi:ribonuclease HI
MTADMRKELLSQLKSWLVKAERGERVSWRKLGSLIGCLNFLRAQIPRASLYLRTLHSVLAAGVKSNGWNGWGSLPRRIISELLFWWRNVWYNTPYEFAARLPQAMLTTDASERGWGAVLEIGELCYTTYGSFSRDQSSNSSNWRETTAVLRALLYYKQVIQQVGIKALSVRTDNMVTVFNLQRQGASMSLLYETRQIFSLLQRMDVRVSVTHIPGIENVMADALSRMDRVGDYSLGKEWYDRGVECLGVRPTLDVFASCNNAKCQRFLALPGRYSKGAVALDALRYSWEGELAYAFPPVQLIPRVLQKIRLEVGEAVLVVPEWPSRPWWNMLQGCVRKQVRLGKAEEVLEKGPTMTARRAKLPPGNMLMAWVSYRR